MKHLVRIPAIAVVTVLALASCGSDSKSDTGSNKTNGSNTNATTGNDSIDKLVAKAKSANVKVTYKTSGSSDELTLVQYNGDTAITTGGDTFISVGGKSYSCTSGTDAQCTEIPGVAGNLAQTMTTGFFGIYAGLFSLSENTSNLFVDVDKSDDSTIAGRSAKCVTMKAGALVGAAGSIVACVDAETGVLLRGSAGSGGDSSTIEATAFADSTADDVKLPAEPTSITG